MVCYDYPCSAAGMTDGSFRVADHTPLTPSKRKFHKARHDNLLVERRPANSTSTETNRDIPPSSPIPKSLHQSRSPERQTATIRYIASATTPALSQLSPTSTFTSRLTTVPTRTRSGTVPVTPAGSLTFTCRTPFTNPGARRPYHSARLQAMLSSRRRTPST